MMNSHLKPRGISSKSYLPLSPQAAEAPLVQPSKVHRWASGSSPGLEEPRAGQWAEGAGVLQVGEMPSATSPGGSTAKRRKGVLGAAGKTGNPFSGHVSPIHEGGRWSG